MNTASHDIKRLTGLTPALFQHPSDRAILAKLEGVPVIPGLVGKLLDTLKEKIEIDLLANSFHVTTETFPDLYAIYQRACATLCVDSPPPLYAQCSSSYNAYTMGVDKAFIVVNSSLASDFNEAELTYVLGHELGHVLSGHVKYQTLVYLITDGVVSLLGGRLMRIAANVTFGPLLYLWSRRAEYTADRVGLLACQDINVAYRANLRMAGCPKQFVESLPQDVLLKQSEEYQERVSKSLLSNMFSGMNQIFSTHPRIIDRASELKSWIDEGWFEDIVEGSEDSRRTLGGQVSADPQMAEMMRLLMLNIVHYATKEFAVPHAEAKRLIRRAIFGNETLRHTALERILRIELAITREGSDKVRHTICSLVNKGGHPVAQRLALPMPDSWDDTPAEIRKVFITQNKDAIVNVLYSVDTASGVLRQ